MPEKDTQFHDASFGNSSEEAGSSNDSECDKTTVIPPLERGPSAEELAVELAALKERLLQSLAEQENIRGQARRDMDEAVRYAASGFARDLLSSVDNLERAITSVPEESRAEPLIAALLSGVEATKRGLLEAFARHGLKRLDPIGEAFDPHRHEASFDIPDPRYPPGTITSVIQPGYIHHDRLLRPALVGVSKTLDGGPPSIDAP